MNTKHSKRSILAATVLACALISSAHAVLSFNVATSGWPNAAHRDAAIAAAQSAVNRYNAYGDFGNSNIHIYYNAGIPTAQANYLGSVGFGGTYPNERVMMHEFAHYLGSGTYGHPWNGPRGEALIDQFDGIEADLNGDGAHFWPYGLNYDNEGAEINKQRHVALLYAQRADLGIGSAANPWTATTASLTANDPFGESGFNYASRWSDTRFAHAAAAYSTGQFLLRTPLGPNSFTFAGESLRVNNTNGENGGLQYEGSGSTGILRFKNLILDNGRLRHDSAAGDTFRVAGNINLLSSPTIDAAQGPITITARIGGSGSLTKIGSFPLTLGGGNSYTGATNINAGILRLSPTTPIADYTFDSVSGSTVINRGTGGAPMNGTLANGAAIVPGGRFGNSVRLINGASVDINHPITDLSPASSWTISAWVRTTTPGASILTKGDGAGWSSGNTIFYLGDGSAQGSGGIPSSVRWGGGFFQGSPYAMAVNDNNWHQVTYVNSHGTWAIYVDGVPQPLSAANNDLSNADIGSIVRLGVSTNTVAADGTVNFNGLLDSVQFYNQALSPGQVAALYQGTPIGPLPSTTTVSIASGATLDVNGLTQQIASLNGPAGSAVTLGAGQLIISSPSGSTQFSGTISGTGGSLVKDGNSTLTLSAANTYTGGTIVNAGTLIVANDSALGTGPLALRNSSLLTVSDTSLRLTSLSIQDSAKLDLADNTLILTSGNLADASSLITTGSLFSSLADANHTLAAVTNTPGVRVTYALIGDLNLDRQVSIADFLTLSTNFGLPNTTWSTGDLNHDNQTTIADFLNLAARFGMSMSAASPVPVPEPTLAAVAALLALTTRRVARASCR